LDLVSTLTLLQIITLTLTIAPVAEIITTALLSDLVAEEAAVISSSDQEEEASVEGIVEVEEEEEEVEMPVVTVELVACPGVSRSAVHGQNTSGWSQCSYLRPKKV
jgi:hypothetical protein